MPERPNSYPRYPFYKKYSREWLEGSIRFDCDPAERSVFEDFLSMANESRNRGKIQANDETPYPHPWLAAKLNIPLELLEHCIEKFTGQGRISEDEHGILVINFDYWQGLDTTRGRGRPSRPKREAPEQTEESKLKTEYSTKLSLATQSRKKELGRDLSKEEMQETMAEIRKEVYGE